MTVDVATGLWSEQRGDGPVVVLVHGTMDRSTSFGRVMRALEGDHRVRRYDRRGYGRSADAGPPVSFDQQVDDLVSVIDGTPSIVAGHSYGGTVALATAARHPDLVRAVVVYECPLPWLDWWPTRSAGAQAVSDAVDPADAAERFMRRMLGDDRWAKLPPSTRRARREEGETLVAEMAQLRDGTVPFALTDVTVPVIAAHGTHGVEHHQTSVETVASEVADGELVVVDGASHGVHLTHPADFADLVRRAEAAAGQGSSRLQ